MEVDFFPRWVEVLCGSAQDVAAKANTHRIIRKRESPLVLSNASVTLSDSAPTTRAQHRRRTAGAGHSHVMPGYFFRKAGLSFG